MKWNCTLYRVYKHRLTFLYLILLKNGMDFKISALLELILRHEKIILEYNFNADPLGTWFANQVESKLYFGNFFLRNSNFQKCLPLNIKSKYFDVLHCQMCTINFQINLRQLLSFMWAIINILFRKFWDYCTNTTQVFMKMITLQLKSITWYHFLMCKD